MQHQLLVVVMNQGKFFFGKRFGTHPMTHTLFCGIVLKPFDICQNNSKRQELLKQYLLPLDSIVIGNVGSLDDAKNQSFLINVFSELAKRNQRYVLFIAGEGDKRTELELLIKKLNLERRIIMPGSCSNIPELECNLFDVFCLPSTFEGLPLSIIEAISAGLHVVCSDIITQDILSVISKYSTHLNLDAPISAWIDALENGIKYRRTPQEGITTIRQTSFCIENSATNLLELYKSNF
jgi:glycosyltransferase EpsF